MQSLWLSPTEFVSGDSTLLIEYPSVTGPATVIRCSSPGSGKWISMAVNVPGRLQIRAITVCYQTLGGGSSIEQVRLTDMAEPNTALVIHDDAVSLSSGSPASYTSVVANATPHHALTLDLRLNFADVSSSVLLGAVGVTFVLVGQMCVNAKEFGALGNGSDATQEIQAALNAAGAAGGAVVCLATGQYGLSAPLAMPSNTELRGTGPGRTVLRLADNAKTDMIINGDPTGGNSGITITNLELDGNKGNNSRKSVNPGASCLQGTWDQAGIQWIRVSRSRIENCVVHDCAWNGIVMSASRDIDIIGCRSDANGNVRVGTGGWCQFEAMGILLWEGGARQGNTGVRISACTVTRNEKHGIELLGPSNQDNLVSQCIAADNNSYGITINAAGSNHAGTIIGCTCLDNCDAGIGIFGDRIIAEGNFLARNSHCLMRGLLAPPTPISTASINVQGKFCTIANNIVEDTLPKVTGSSADGIAVDGAHNRLIGNTVIRAFNRGIGFGGESEIVIGSTVVDAGLSGVSAGIQGNQSTGALLQGNTVEHSARSGILFNGPGGGHRVTGNQVINSGLSGIEISSQHDCIVEGNTAISNGSGGTGKPQRAGIAITGGSQQIAVNSNRCGNDPNKGLHQDYGIVAADPACQALISGNILVGNNQQALDTNGAAITLGPNLT
jgi:parallel beta-helix repeat protein